jgi:hypothetical protein
MNRNKIIALSLLMLVMSGCPGFNNQNNSAVANKTNQNSSQVNVFNGYSKNAVVSNPQPPNSNYISPVTATNTGNSGRTIPDYNNRSSSSANVSKTP